MRRRACGSLLLSLVLLGPASAETWRAAQEGDGYSSERRTVRASESPRSAGEVLSVAQAFAGLPYVWAGRAPTTGFDCSGYVYEVLRLNGHEVPRMAHQQFEASQRVAYDDLQPGDMVFFQTYMPGPSHVGFFLGQGDFIHASSAADGVVVSSMQTGYYRERFLGGGRPEAWLDQPHQLAQKAVEPVVVLSTPAVDSALGGVEPKFNPFSRTRGPQPVRTSVVPEVQNSSERAWQEWKLILGETLSVGRLQLQGLLKGLARREISRRSEL